MTSAAADFISVPSVIGGIIPADLQFINKRQITCVTYTCIFVYLYQILPYYCYARGEYFKISGQLLIYYKTKTFKWLIIKPQLLIIQP